LKRRVSCGHEDSWARHGTPPTGGASRLTH
jgi:hypothetical protein